MLTAKRILKKEKLKNKTTSNKKLKFVDEELTQDTLNMTRNISLDVPHDTSQIFSYHNRIDENTFDKVNKILITLECIISISKRKNIVLKAWWTKNLQKD